MRNNTQTVLVAVIFALVVVIGLLVFNQTYHRPETLGEKVGRGIDRATGDLGNAIDETTRRKSP